jgi:hypothetical protein
MMFQYVDQDFRTGVGFGVGAKPVMNSFTYMRSEADCVWQIAFEQATMRDKNLIGSKAMHRVMLIFQGLEASTQSDRIRTGVNEMMTRFVGAFLEICSSVPSGVGTPKTIPRDAITTKP